MGHAEPDAGVPPCRISSPHIPDFDFHTQTTALDLRLVSVGWILMVV